MTNMWTATPFNHVILIGYGRVGRMVGDALLRSGDPFIAIDQDRRTVEAMRMLGVNAVFGDATRPATLALALPDFARLVVITTRDPYRTRHLIELVRARNPTIEILVRTHGEEEQQLFEQMGVSHVLMADRELAYGMAYQSLRSIGASDDKADWIIGTLRGGGRTATQEFSAMTPTSLPSIPR
jgi:CPA2 family monovalent cation:H+ antiporter-2